MYIWKESYSKFGQQIATKSCISLSIKVSSYFSLSFLIQVFLQTELMPISQNYDRITSDWLTSLIELKHSDTPENNEQMKSFFKLYKHEVQTVLLHRPLPQLLLCSALFHV